MDLQWRPADTSLWAERRKYRQQGSNDRQLITYGRIIIYLFALQYLGGEYLENGSYTRYADILEFSPPTDPTNPRTGQWKLVANMTRTREDHALSVIDHSQVAHFCTED